MLLFFKVWLVTLVTIYLLITTMISVFVFLAGNPHGGNFIENLMFSITVPHVVLPKILWDMLTGK
jgi:hypothetical protein